MAIGTSLVIEAIDESGNKRTFSWANANPSTQDSFIRTFVATLIAQSSAILRVPIVSVSAAVLRTVTEKDVDLEDE